MVETIRSLGHLRLPLYVLCDTIVGNPAGMRVGTERQRWFVLGHARAAVETAVDVPDHGDSLSPDREETIMNPIRKIKNKVRDCCLSNREARTVDCIVPI